eukprot:jgi/Botrbrau1/14318/Bobra.0287s0011.1
MGMWKLLVEVALPIPFVLLVLLCVPAPRWFRRGVLNLVDKTLGLTVVGVTSLLHVMLVISGAALLGTARDTLNYSKNKIDPAEVSPNIAAANLSKRWRSERNFWISFITFTLWCLLARVYRILRHQVKLEDQLDKVLARPTVEAFKSNISAATRPAGPAPNVTTTNVDAPSAPPMEVPVLAKKAK